MSLGKVFTLKSVVNTILLWLNEELQNNLEPELVKNYIHLSVLEESEIISINTDDYGVAVDVTDGTTNISTTVETAQSYVDATRTVTDTAHGLVDGDIGKRIILSTSSRIGIFTIESITDVDHFVISSPFGANTLSTNYVVLSPYSTSAIDLSGYQIMNIVKLTSTTLKEIKKVGDIEADNIERNDFKAMNKVFWYKHGEFIHLVIPTGVNPGTLKLFYNTYPQKKTLDTDYLDIRDNYIPKVIQRTKKKCLEHLGIAPHDTNQDKQDLNAERKKSIIVENRTGIDG